MRLWSLLPIVALAGPVPVYAQVQPVMGSGDPRIQSVVYDPDQVVQLQVAAGYQLSIEFAPDERIENVAIGDSAAWQVTPNKRGDHLFLKIVQPGASTNLVVVTDARTYAFELSPLYGPLPTMAYTVRFRYPPPAEASAIMPAGPVVSARYRMSGPRQLRPSRIEDDGERTYLTWGPDRTLPAIFTIDSQGRETLADGAMRDERFVINGVSKRLIFRIDKRFATAVRIAERSRR